MQLIFGNVTSASGQLMAEMTRIFCISMVCAEGSSWRKNIRDNEEYNEGWHPATENNNITMWASKNTTMEEGEGSYYWND